MRPHKSTSGILSLPSDIETGGRENGGGGRNRNWSLIREVVDLRIPQRLNVLYEPKFFLFTHLVRAGSLVR